MTARLSLSLLGLVLVLGASGAAAEERILRETPFGGQEIRTPDGRRLEQLPPDPLDKGGYVERTITPRVFGAPEPTPLRDSYRLDGADQRGSFRPRPLPSSGLGAGGGLGIDQVLGERRAGHSRAGR